MFKILSWIFLILLSCHQSAYPVIVAKNVEVRLTIEDGEMNQPNIIQAKFDCEEIDLSKKNFMHRKVNTVYFVSPGQYEIEWTTEKNEKPWGGKKEIKKHHRAIVIELSDAIVYIKVRGENLTTY